MHRRDAGAGFEQLNRVVGQAAGAAGTVIELAGVGFSIGHQLSHRLPPPGLVDDDHLRDRADDTDGREILYRVVAYFLQRIEGRNRDGADAAEAEHISVGWRSHDRLRADDAARTRTMINNDRL